MMNIISVKAIQDITLSRNDQLTIQSFGQNDDNFFVKNNISNLYFSFLNDYNTLRISEDLDVDLTGNIELISIENCSGFIGFYEGNLNDGTFLSVSLTYSDNKMLAVLTVGYMGDELFGSTYFGDTSEKIKSLDDVFSKRVIAQNQLEEQNSIQLDVENISQPDAVSNNVDATIRLQGTATATAGGYVIGRLSAFHANELRVQGSMTTTAKVNTNRSGVRNYLSGAGYNTTSVYIVPIQFNMYIKSETAALVATTGGYAPENSDKEYEITIPYTGSNGSINTTSFNIKTETTTLSKAKSTGAVSYNQFTWILKKLLGWGQTELDGDSSSTKGMATEVSFTYQDSVPSNPRRTLMFSGQIKYKIVYYPDPDSDTQKTINISTSQMAKSTVVTIV